MDYQVLLIISVLTLFIGSIVWVLQWLMSETTTKMGDRGKEYSVTYSGKSAFPQQVSNYRYDWNWVQHCTHVRKFNRNLKVNQIAYPVEGVFVFNPAKHSMVKGDLIPAFKHKGKIGLYRIVRAYHSSDNDLLHSFDNGVSVDLVLVKKVKEAKYAGGND